MFQNHLFAIAAATLMFVASCQHSLAAPRATDVPVVKCLADRAGHNAQVPLSRNIPHQIPRPVLDLSSVQLLSVDGARPDNRAVAQAPKDAVDSVAIHANPIRSRDAIRRISDVTPQFMLRHNTPGVSIAIIESRKIVKLKCFGVQRAGTQQPVTEQTVFEACSMSKPLFAYAVLRLAQEQKLDLDRPLSDYLETPYLVDQPLHLRITGRMVLNHTTGFPNWRKGGWRAGGPLPVRFEPGTQFGYSGEGFWFFQQVVEQIVGESIETWMQRKLMKPIGMSSSSYVWQTDYESTAAAGHSPDGTVKTDRRLYDRANVAFSLYTTPQDYSRFLIEMMTADRSQPHSLNQTMLEEMLRPDVETDDADVWRSLGWVVNKSGESPQFSHSGANGSGFRCYCQFSPKQGDGIVIMTNAIDGASVWKGITDSIVWP